MTIQSKRTGLRNRMLAPIVTLIILLAAEQASAQVFFVPVQRRIPLGGSFNVGPVVVSGDRRFVRVGGTFSGMIVNPNRGFNQLIFVPPVTANERIRRGFFYGPNGPFTPGRQNSFNNGNGSGNFPGGFRP